jgi:hypothetical protein
MTMRRIKCAHCGKRPWKPVQAINRAERAGAPLYCNRTCAGLARRNGKTKAQRREEKRLYDMNNRATNPTLKARRHEQHLRNYDPVAAAVVRKARMPQHLEYCRRPEYRAWKSAYDKRHLAEKQYGPAAEAAMVLRDLEREIRSRMNAYEVAQASGTFGKRQGRQRAAARVVSSRA